MLAYLRIKNLAVVDDVALELAPGLTVFTGETGAGKSMILGGLSLVLGERASLDQVRAGEQRAVVEAAFTAPRDAELAADLADSGLATEDGSIVVRRVITASGSRAYVNDQLVSLQKLRDVGERLVDLHGQHEHQSLLSVRAHRELLDRYAGAAESRDAVAAAYDEAVEIAARLEELTIDERDRAQRVDLLRFQVQEIDAAQLRPGEDEELDEERRRLAHAEELTQLAGEAVETLYEGDRSVAAVLARVQRDFERLARLDPSAPVDVEGVKSARITAEEAGRSMQRYLDDLEVEPERLAGVEARLSALHALQRKYGDDIATIIEHGEQAARELDELERHDERLSELQAALVDAVARYARASADLGDARRRAAGELEKLVVEELAGLGMEGARFEVAIGPRRRQAPAGLPDGAGRSGSDRVEYVLAANAGEAPAALSKVASGGELSRVMLALKLSAGDDDPLETMVFDEVDSGIGGGRVAERLAQRLSLLGRTHQVLVVTHLPQVAAYADTHVGIRKGETGDGRVAVEARTLADGEQVEELARMLGGLEVTEATRRHAREMLERR
ncbi:MAG: DNA repair protein RecN [Acidobacteriota bacterium]|jgi:DNA repair protein RecN (Recombination protein N)